MRGRAGISAIASKDLPIAKDLSIAKDLPDLPIAKNLPIAKVTASPKC